MLSKRITTKQNICIKAFIEVYAYIDRNRLIIYCLNFEVNEFTNYAATNAITLYRVRSLY